MTTRTYGKLALSGKGNWVLNAEPHVIIRAKRLFAGAAQNKEGRIYLSDTVETCRELDWFRDRYPLEMSPKDEAYLVSRSTEHRERESLVAKLLSGTGSTRAFELAVPPRDYQKIAAEITLRTGQLLLADEMGLGKTVSAICMLSDPRARPAVVVTLASLCKQWQREIQRFAPGLSTHILKKGTPYDLTLAPGARKGQMTMPGTFPDVVITSYPKLVGWANTLAPLIRSVVYDECQDLRGGDSTQKGSAARVLSSSASIRMGLSGTPIYNMGSEIHSVLGFIAPDALGTREEFLREWCGYVDQRGRSRLKDPKAFGTHLRETGLMLRRTCADVGRELPPEIRVPHHIQTDDGPLKDITTAATELARIIVETSNPSAARLQAAGELDAMVRQATGVAKAPYVAEFVRMLLEQDHPVVLFGWHRSVYDIWLERLAQYKPALFTGSESASQKDRARERFVSGETPLLIMSLRSGAGIDGLQKRCRTVVFGELDWSPGVHEQCITRLKRDDQQEQVIAYYMIADEGSDPIVADILQVKRSQVEGIRNPNADIIEQLDVSGDRIRALAEAYLAKARGRPAAPRQSVAAPPSPLPELQKSLL